MIVLDVTHGVHPGMQTYPAPWHVSVAFDQLTSIPESGRRASSIRIGSHSGTHVDAPSHFVEAGKTIDEFPIELSLGPATVLDLREWATASDISASTIREASQGAPLGQRVIIRLGWARRYGASNFYSESPAFTLDAAQHLLECGVRLVGYDTPSLDRPDQGMGCEVDSPIHKLLLENEVWLAEYLALPDTQLLPPAVQWLIAPLALQGLDGSPARSAIGIQ